MSITIGIYDFFAYTLPGGFYLFLICYCLWLLNLIQIDFQTLNTVETPVMFLGLSIAYILGLLMNALARQWHRLFAREDVIKSTLEKIREDYPELVFTIQARDWRRLRMLYWSKDKDFVARLERMNVTRIMLRNFSLGFALLTLIQAIVYIPHRSQLEVLLVGGLAAVASIISGTEGAKYGRWFYELGYQALASYAVTPTDWVKRRADCSEIADPGE
jgi:hypothetical protein